MGDEIQNTKTTAEDLAIERAEQQLADPSAANMQFLQSTLVNNEFDGVGASTGFFNASAKQSISSPSHSGGGFSGLSPAYSGAGLLGAVAAADMGGASSAMGIAAQVASAAPVTFGKEAVGESATLAALGDKALVQPVDGNSALLKPLANADGSMVPLSPEFSQLLAMLEGNLWLHNARSANAAAQIIADAAAGRLLYPVQANEIFLRLTPAEAAALRAQGFDFYDWGVVNENWGAARLVTSWQHTEADVAPLARAIAAL